MVENPILNERYRLVEQIGAGGMAVIYKAQDMELGRMVAVKVLRPSLVGDPEFLVRFKQEARSAANLSHPNIVTVHDVGQDGPKTHYIVMEYVPGQDLKQVIRARGAFEVDAALAIVIEVCKGVGYAHRAGLVHCDMKPQNILITPDRSIKVVDFGIARALSNTQSNELEEVVWGSPHYFSPEQAVGESPTPASDVYSIGIVLFELLTGKLPFTGQDYRELAMAHVSKEPPSLLDINPALPAELDRIIKKVLSKEPATRYRTADQLGRILEKYNEQGVQPTSTFVVTPSKVQTPPPTIQPPRGLERVKPPVGAEPTMPSLPPVDYQEVIRRPMPAAAPSPSTSYYQAEEDDYGDVFEEDFLESIDIYGIVLGVLAAVAVLGLIPLWVTIFITFTR